MDTTLIAPVTEYHQITFDEYLSAKQEITNRLRNMSEDYIAVGFLLRQIKETEAYKQEGYESLQDFAKKEFNLSESAVSRFIAINKKFSKDGYSKELSSEYIGFGNSKLGEMLNMSDEDCKLITVDTTVAQIREIKSFNREEEKLAAEQQIEGQQTVEETIAMYESGEIPSGSEEEEIVTAEVLAPQAPVNTRTYSDLETVLIEFFRDKKELLNDIYSLSSYEDIVEKINPSGNLSYRYKIYMLFMYGYGDGVILKKMGAGNTNYTWPDVIQAIVDIYKDTYTDHDTVHQNFYSQDKPVEAEKLTEPPKATVEEYETPHPESITSICYSCTKYETCNVKKSTCTKCDQYKNRAEAYKTDEQRYEEEQARIDKETAKKLQDMADEKKMEKLPSEQKPRGQQVHEIKIGAEFYEEVVTGRKTFELRKNDRGYKEGDLLVLEECIDGEKTGSTVTMVVTYILEDYTGLQEGYCIMAIAPAYEEEADE